MALIDKTYAAVNYGYGIKHIHPEYYFGGPYGTIPTIHASRGGRAINQNENLDDDEQETYVRPFLSGSRYLSVRPRPLNTGYIQKRQILNHRGINGGCNVCRNRARRLREMRQIANANLKGSGLYNLAALRGYGMQDIINKLSMFVGDTSMALLRRLAERLDTTLPGLLSDPDKLVALLKRVSPTIAKTVQVFFRVFRQSLKLKNTEPSHNTKAPELDEEGENMPNYLSWLKKNNPQSYADFVKKFRQKIWNRNLLESNAQFYRGDVGVDDTPPIENVTEITADDDGDEMIE